MEDYVFEYLKGPSVEAAKKYPEGPIPGPVDQGGLFHDIFNLVEELGGKIPSRPESYIKNYFYNLKLRIKLTQEKKELQKLKKNITKMKIDVNKNIKKEFDKGKKEILNLLEKEMKLKKEGKK